MSNNNCVEVQLFDLISKTLDSHGYHIFVTMVPGAFDKDTSKDTSYEYEYVVLTAPKLEDSCKSIGNYIPLQRYNGCEIFPMYYTYTGEQNMLTKYCIDHGLSTRLLYDHSNIFSHYFDYLYLDDMGLSESHEYCDLAFTYEDFEKYLGFPHDEFCKIIISRIISDGFVFEKQLRQPIISIESHKYINAEELLINMHISNNMLDNI